MRQDEFEFMPQLKLLISGNHKPGLRSVDEAIRRRFHLIPFTVTIPDERDPDLADKLKVEWPAILAWMIEGCIHGSEKGLRPQQPSRRNRRLPRRPRGLAAWLEECCECDPRGFETRTALFSSWNEWADGIRRACRTRSRFLDALEARGFEPARTAGRGSSGASASLRQQRRSIIGASGENLNEINAGVTSVTFSTYRRHARARVNGGTR